MGSDHHHGPGHHGPGHQHHGQDHGHGHGHDHPDIGLDAPRDPDDLPAALDLRVPDSELSPADVSRRGFLRRAGLLGAGLAATSATSVAGPLATAGAATTPDPAADHRSGRAPVGGWRWLAGDHHIHTQYSPDGLYRVIDQVRHGNAFGLDWMVITDHGSAQHVRIGVERVNPDIQEARRLVPDSLVFQGLEWNIPAAEHATVFVLPGEGEVPVLKAFEAAYDAAVTGSGGSTPANEELALQGLDFLASSVQQGSIGDALMLANHPARRGVDSPHEIRGWRDRQPTIAVGFEGAPGHQAAGLPAPLGPAEARGYYGGSPSAASFPGFPLESYRTWGGFDWMTATVGGLWDSLLAEGRPWWITANSDSHANYLDTATRGDQDFQVNGFYGDPVYSGTPNTEAGDFWPGYYSRTHVGASGFGYQAVMAGLRAGRVWVDHGGLLDSLDVQLRVVGGPSTTLGGVLTARPDDRVRLVVDVRAAVLPNWAGFLPRLAKVDLVRGAVTGPVADRDAFTTPATRVVQTWDTTGTDRLRVTYDLGEVGDGFFVRLRGSDGNRLGAGYLGAEVDPAGPVIDEVGNADPWLDLWFYTNPMWVVPRS